MHVAWLLFCLGILAVGEIKLGCQSSLSLILSKANLRQKAWLGRPTALTVGLFVWGNNTEKMLWSDS